LLRLRGDAIMANIFPRARFVTIQSKTGITE
jgi:hypothetical protein